MVIASNQVRKRTIMLIDDEQDIVLIFKKALEKQGFLVQEFTDAVSALKAFEDNPAAFDAVVSDIRMPVMSGWDLVSNVKKLRREVKVIVVSAFETDVTADRLASIEAYLAKPVSVNQLTAELRKQLETDTVN